MVLQVLPDARPVGDDWDAVLGKVPGRADPRQHEKLRRVDRGSRDHDLTSCLNDFYLFASLDLYPGRALILDDDAPRETLDEANVSAFQSRLQIGVGGRPAAAVVD